MKSIWFHDEDDQEQFKKNVLGSKIVLDKAIKILYTYIQGGDKTKLEDFDSPSWAFKQAYQEGRKAAFRQVIDILTLDEKKDA